jgi:hypothetical protein
LRFFARAGGHTNAGIPRSSPDNDNPKDIAYELYVDTLDLRVYSGRKGRMWRTPNVRRESGKYKVPITPEELMEMTAADYEALCSQPRIIPAPAEPVLSQKRAVLYAKAESKVDAAAKKRKDSKKDFELLARFKGQFPPSLAAVMAGTGRAHGRVPRDRAAGHDHGECAWEGQVASTREVPACGAEVRPALSAALSVSLSGRPTSRLQPSTVAATRASGPYPSPPTPKAASFGRQSAPRRPTFP